MERFIMILLVAAAIGVLYTYVVTRFSKNKILIFLPAILITLWFIYIRIFYIPKLMGGFEDLAIIIVEIIFFALLLGNLLSGLFKIFKDRNK